MIFTQEMIKFWKYMPQFKCFQILARANINEQSANCFKNIHVLLKICKFHVVLSHEVNNG